MPPFIKYFYMAKVTSRCLKTKRYQRYFDLRGLTFEEYMVIKSLVLCVDREFRKRSLKVHYQGTFKLTSLLCEIYADESCFKTLNKLSKVL